MACFFMPMIPPTVTAQEQRINVKTKSGKPAVYKGERLADAKDKLIAHLSKHIPEKPLGGPVELHVMWCFPLPASGKHRDGEPKVSKPDTDNLEKLLKDCMTKCGFWKDDAQVFDEHVIKVYDERPGILISVHEFSEDTIHDEP